MKNKSVERKYAQTQRNASSDSEKKNTQRRSLTQTSIAEMSIDDFEARILDVNIRKPRSAYNFYISDMKEKHGGDSKITDVAKEYGKKWSKLSSKEKDKYEKMAAEDKDRYAEHTQLVKKFILAKPLKENATAMNIFVEEKVSEAIENGEDVKEAKKAAKDKWREMSTNEKEVYEEKKEKHREFYEELKDAGINGVSAYTLYCKDMMSKAREKGETMTLKDCAANWKNVKQSIKEKYEAHAEEVKEERAKQRDIYEIAFNVKPKRPNTPYTFYLMELAKDGKFTNFKEASKSWKNLPEDDKEKYLRMAKKAQLCYQMKMAEYKSSVRKIVSKPKSALNLFIEDMKGKGDDMKENDNFLSYCYTKWRKLEENTKKKYQKKADELAEEHAERKEELGGRVFEMPKRPRSGYNLYLAERLPQLKEKHATKPVTELFKMVALEWSGMKKSQKDKYQAAYEKEVDAYKEKVKEYRINGFYTPDKSDMRKSTSKRSVSKMRDTKKGKAK
jgi:hypothetical protein